MPKTTKHQESSPSGNPPKAQSIPAKGGELAEAELDRVAGGNEPTKHPAKVTIPDIKLSIS